MAAPPDFEQTKGLFKHRLSFGPYGLTYLDRTFGPGKERSILYENLAMDQVVCGAHLDLISGVVAFGTGIAAMAMWTTSEKGFFAGLPWFLACILASIYGWLRSGRYVEIPVLQDTPMLLYEDRPDRERVNRLLADLTSRTRDYAIRKFGPIQGTAPREEQVGRLRWFRDRNYITDDELQEWLKDLEQGTKFRSSGTIGFGTSPKVQS